MQVLLRLANIARERGVSSKRAHQLVRGIEPAAMTPDGLRLYDPSVLETLTKRRRRWQERRKAEALEVVP